MKPMHAPDTIVQETTIHAPIDRVFAALTDPAERSRWWKTPRSGDRPPHVESDLRPGGKWLMRFDGKDRAVTIRGEYLTVERPHLLIFTWLPDWYENAATSTVRFDLTEQGGATTVRVTHSGLTTEADRTSHRGWPDILASLQGYAESA